MSKKKTPVRLAIAGIGNCASSFVEGISWYRQHPRHRAGLLFPVLGGYGVEDIDVAAAFDVSREKVGKPLAEAIHAKPNNFVRIPEEVRVPFDVVVQRGPSFDGNPAHLAQMVPESKARPVDVVAALRKSGADVVVNLLPTGSIEATEHYGAAALEAGCAFVNCIPTIYAQRPEVRSRFKRKKLPVLGDDIKSQLGTTILHRTLLQMLQLRGADLVRTSQVNIGGNTDFANFVHRAETKLVSKRKSMTGLLGKAEFHVGHHYDLTRGPWKHAFIDIEARVFGASPVRISVKLESDDKPNSAGSVVDLVRIAKAARDAGLGGAIDEACAFYMKSPPALADEGTALAAIRERWSRR